MTVIQNNTYKQTIVSIFDSEGACITVDHFSNVTIAEGGSIFITRKRGDNAILAPDEWSSINIH